MPKTSALCLKKFWHVITGCVCEQKRTTQLSSVGFLTCSPKHNSPSGTDAVREPCILWCELERVALASEQSSSSPKYWEQNRGLVGFLRIVCLGQEFLWTFRETWETCLSHELVWMAPLWKGKGRRIWGHRNQEDWLNWDSIFWWI